MSKPYQYSAALELIKEQQDESADKIERFRVACKKYMNGSTFGLVYENVNLIISTISSFQRIYMTYLVKGHQEDEMEIRVAALMGLIFISFFAVDWLLNLFLADSKSNYMFR